MAETAGRRSWINKEIKMKIVKRCGPSPVWTSLGWATMSNLYKANDKFLSEEGPNADPEFDMTLLVNCDDDPDFDSDMFVNVRSIDFKEI